MVAMATIITEARKHFMTKFITYDRHRFLALLDAREREGDDEELHSNVRSAFCLRVVKEELLRLCLHL